MSTTKLAKVRTLVLGGNNTALEQSEAPEGTALRRFAATFRTAVKVPLVLATVALPLALATPSHASTATTTAATETAGCTLKTPLRPEKDFGADKAAYKVTVSCPAFIPVYVQVQQKWYEHDANGDEFIGKKTSYQAMPLGGDHTFSVSDELPDTEAGAEEMWQKARFFAVNELPIPPGTTYGPYKKSGVRSLSN